MIFIRMVGLLVDIILELRVLLDNKYSDQTSGEIKNRNRMQCGCNNALKLHSKVGEGCRYIPRRFVQNKVIPILLATYQLE